MIAVKVKQLFLSNMGFVVLLKGTAEEKSLPIFIGAAEAQAIASEISGAERPPRPMTHDLIKNLLDYIECRLMKVEVHEVKNGTFYARLILERDGNHMEMDSRPSDAIALALRCSSPIYVAKDVMNDAGRVFDAEQEETHEGLDATSGTKKLAHEMTPIEVLRQKLEKAVKEERYEDAARARDEINRLNHTSTDN